MRFRLMMMRQTLTDRGEMREKTDRVKKTEEAGKEKDELIISLYIALLRVSSSSAGDEYQRVSRRDAMTIISQDRVLLHFPSFSSFSFTVFVARNLN